MIAIEGIVGVGKTTFGKLLSEACGEPFHTELSTGSLVSVLKLYYADQERWGFLTQIKFLLERYKKIRDIAKAQKGVLDRSIYGDTVFAKYLYDRGIFTTEEYKVYQELYEHLMINIQAPSLLVLLDCKTEIALQRIRTRNRDFESRIDLSYLEGLASYYHEWFDSYNFSEKMLIKYDDVSPKYVNRAVQEIITTYLPSKWGNRHNI